MNKKELQQFLESKIDANEKLAVQRFETSNVALAAALAAAKELVVQAQISAGAAVQKAEIASEKRFEGVNEFRGQLADQQRTFIPRSECEARFNANEERLKKVESRDIEFRGHHQGSKDGWGWAVAAVMFVMAVGSMVFNFTRP